MARQWKGTSYRKWKSPNGRGRYAGRVHLQFLERGTRKKPGKWRFVCGKRDEDQFGGPPQGDVCSDEELLTCISCIKQAGVELYDYMEIDVPSLDDVQDEPPEPPAVPEIDPDIPSLDDFQ